MQIDSVKVLAALKAHEGFYERASADQAFDMLGEEAGELLTAISHFKRGRVERAKVLEEVGDVMLLLRLLTYLWGAEDDVIRVMDAKADRFGDRVKQWRAE